MQNQPSMSSPELPLPLGPENSKKEQITNLPSPEVQSVKAELPGASDPTALASTTVPLQDLSAQAASQAIPIQQPAVNDGSHSTIDDVDVLQKEWVERAKAIVARTGQDPRIQSKELGKFKAEYVHKRFHKEVKTAEDAA